MDLWTFAARNDFDELQEYCLEEANVFNLILQILQDEERGLRYFLKEAGIRVSAMNRVVQKIAMQISPRLTFGFTQSM